MRLMHYGEQEAFVPMHKACKFWARWERVYGEEFERKDEIWEDVGPNAPLDSPDVKFIYDATNVTFVSLMKRRIP